MTEHMLYKTEDKDASDAIRDANGEVVLAQCRICGLGEIELEETPDCPGLPEHPDATPDTVDFGAPRVRLKWYTPQGDKLVAHMARVSNTKATISDPADSLIGFLLRNHHWSPFEMVNMCVEIHTERDISAQILRHSKEFRFQEFSTRYAEVEDLRWSTECRFQDAKNRQHSLTVGEVMDGVRNVDEALNRDTVDEDTVSETVAYFDAVVNETRTRSLEAYRELLSRGVAKECARRILPIGLMPTVMYINSNLRGWIHYLAERTKPGVQKEHREIALAVEPHFEACFPMVWKAVLAYRGDQERKEQCTQVGMDLYDLLDEYGSDWRKDMTPIEAVRLSLEFGKAAMEEQQRDLPHRS